MKDKKKKKLAKLEKLEKQKSEEKPKKKKKSEAEQKQKKEKKNKQPEAPLQEQAIAPADFVKEAQEKSEKPAKHSTSGASGKQHTVPADDAAASLLFRALGDDVRLQLVQLIRENGELCAADLLKSVSIVQSTLSHHMKILCESGVVSCRRQGKWSYYSIDPQKLLEAAAYLEMLAAAAKAAGIKESSR